jgi:hypothetical protein
MPTVREVVLSLADATSDLIAATFSMADPDLCEDPRVVAFVHAVNEFADGVLDLLKVVDQEDDNAVA